MIESHPQCAADSGEVKTCPGCSQPKPASEFGKRRKTCSECRAQASRRATAVWYQKNKEKVAAYDARRYEEKREYYQAHSKKRYDDIRKKREAGFMEELKSLVGGILPGITGAILVTNQGVATPMTLLQKLNFFRKVAFTDDDSCWLWTGAKNHKFPHGRFRLFSRGLCAHRVSYQIKNGPIPDDILTLHKCDVPNCVRWDHLFLGTYLDNNMDALSKGRHVPVSGEKNSHAKLTDDAVTVIRRSYDSGTLDAAEIARMFSMTTGSVIAAAKKKTWKHIPEEPQP